MIKLSLLITAPTTRPPRHSGVPEMAFTLGSAPAHPGICTTQTFQNEQNSVFDLKRANESSKLNSLKRRQIDRLPAPCGFVPPGSTELALRA